MFLGRVRLPLIINLFAGLVIFSSCGIDNYIYLEPPSQVVHTATNYDDESQKFVLLKLPDSINTVEEPDYFFGYELFYRIYNSTSSRDQDVSAISTYSTNNPTTVQKWLVTNKKFHRLSASARGDTVPLVSKTSNDRKLYIRLTPYGTIIPCLLTGDIPDIITVSAFQAGDNLGSPLRTKDGITDSTDSSYRFDFSEIDSDDPDVQFTSTESVSRWHVQLYIFTYGFDSSYQSIYSSACPLGSITIEQ